MSRAPGSVPIEIRSLDQARCGNLISPGGEGPSEHVFPSDLVREAAYATLTDADRAAGHRLAAAFLERFPR